MAGAFSTHLFRWFTGGTGYGRFADYALGIALGVICAKYAELSGAIPMHRPQAAPVVAFIGAGLILALGRTYRSARPLAWRARRRR